MKRISLAVSALALVALTASVSSAQSAKAVSLGISAGAAIPVSDFGDVYSTGYNGTVSLSFNSVGTPLGIRIDGMYNSFTDRDDLLIDRPNYRIMSANANLVYALPGTGIRPYLIGGAGIYNQKAGDSDDSEDDPFDKSPTNFGLNGGIGAAFPLSGFTTFIEARYHYIFSKEGATDFPVRTAFVPITFGITF